MKITTSLVTRLTLLLGITLTVICSILIATTTLFSYKNTRQQLISNLTHMASIRADLSNHQFEGAERDAASLISRRESYQTPLSQSTTSFFDYDSHYLPMRPGRCNFEHQRNDMWIIQAYGSAGQTYYLDSFIIKKNEGIVLFPPKKISDDYLDQRRKDLLLLPLFPTHDNVYWGMPIKNAQNGWHVSVAVCDRNGTQAGFALKLDSLIDYSASIEKKDINLWLDKEGELLPIFQKDISPEQLHKIIEQLKNPPLHDGWQKTSDYLILRTQLKGPGWQQLVIYPRLGFVWEAAKPTLYQFAFVLILLLLLTSSLTFLLRRYLATPLWNFVNIIGATGPQAMERRLPINKMDELGHIASAYNNLLDRLNEQYDNLEVKVQERTLALAKAKRFAEQANHRKSQHLTTISHEIRTPLSGILGAIELLQNTALDIPQNRLVETARQCSISLLAIINNLLDFSRIESGQLTLSVEKAALLPLLDQIMLTIHSQALNKSLTLSTFVSADIPLELELDALRLKQVLVNLMGNAVKFTEQGEIFLSVKRSDQKLVFTVKDTGCGIDPLHQEAIFEPFIQANDHAQGTGLGLTIANTLAEMMDGKLTLSSELGQGSCFSLCIPLNTLTPSAPFCGELFAPTHLHPQLSAWGIVCQAEPSHPQSLQLTDETSLMNSELFVNNELRYLPGQLYTTLQRYFQHTGLEAKQAIPLQPWQMTLLLVDDSEINRDIIGMMLEQLGHNVMLADSGETALIIGHQQCFDLVLMDIRMPGLDGLATTQLWRDDPMNRDNHCMIAALSANTGPDEHANALNAGMNHSLSKPVTLSQLAELLDITAQFQLERGVSLVPQLSPPRPLLDISNQITSQKLYQSLQVLIQHARNDLDNLPALSHQLHSLKGCAGQAGLIELQDAVMKIEIAISAQIAITPKDIMHLDELINDLFCPRLQKKPLSLPGKGLPLAPK